MFPLVLQTCLSIYAISLFLRLFMVYWQCLTTSHHFPALQGGTKNVRCLASLRGKSFFGWNNVHACGLVFNPSVKYMSSARIQKCVPRSYDGRTQRP